MVLLNTSSKCSPFLLLFLLFLFCFQGEAATKELKHYPAAIHVHSTFSNGEYEVSELAGFARERNIDVLVLTDSFLTTVVYGIWPFDRIAVEGINKMVRPGVRDYGIGRYFAAVREAQKQFPDLVILPGVEVTPYYYWKGEPWIEPTLYNFDRHLIVLGLTERQLENLPVIGNETWGNTATHWTLILVPSGIFLCGILLLVSGSYLKIHLSDYTILRKRRPWAVATSIMLFALLLAWNNYPFGRLGDPHSGQQDILPYQRVIDYVNKRGGIVYWSYPEARYPDVQMGGAKMVSQPHAEDLLLTDGYHGIEGIYGDRITATLPGRVWDLALNSYIEGWRRTPPFLTTGINFHYFKGNPGSWYDLVGGQTILLMPEKSEAAVLEALREGSGYATFQQPEEKLRLHQLSVETFEGAKAFQGGEVEGESPVQVHIHLDWLHNPPEEDRPFHLELIRNGEVVEQVEQYLPIQITSTQKLPSGRHYFRMRARWRGNIYNVLSNPVFVNIQ